VTLYPFHFVLRRMANPFVGLVGVLLGARLRRTWLVIARLRACPVNPMTAPNGEVAAASEKRYVELYEVWTAWWDWKPGK
jgi:hypothetical protein